MSMFVIRTLLSYRLLPIVIRLHFVVLMPIDADQQSISSTAGNTVNISCNARLPFQNADWVRLSHEDAAEIEICLNSGICLNGFATRFSVDTKNSFTLTLRDVTVNDSGHYICIAYSGATYNRYTTQLNVIERLADIRDQSTTKTTSSTAITHQPADEGWAFALIPVGIAAGILCLIVVVSSVLTVKFKYKGKLSCVLCIYRRHGNAENNCQEEQNDATVFNTRVHCAATAASYGSSFDNVVLQNNCAKDIVDTNDDSISSLLKDKKQKSDDTNEECSPQSKLEETKAIAFWSLDQENRLLIISTLKLFREFYNGTNEIAASAKSFELLANTSALWLNKLVEKNAAKRRLHRLLYYECSGYRGDPIRLNSLQSPAIHGHVIGIAFLDGKVYIVRTNSSTILVVPEPASEIVVDGMTRPVDVVACKSDQSLYVADDWRNCIWRVPVGGKVLRWATFDEFAPKTLSVRKNTLLVTTNSHVIVKYAHNGKILARIDLDEGVQPLHAGETSANTFIVCCKLARANLVLEVGLDGKEIRRFVCVAQLLRSPSYLVLDQAGRLLVADYSNNRVLLVDSKLKHGRTIINQLRDGIVAPHRLCVDGDTGRLFIVQCNKNHVDTFLIKKDQEHART